MTMIWRVIFNDLKPRKMNTRDKITVISGWLDDVPNHAKEARKFMDELFEENTKLAMELEEVKNNSSISDVSESLVAGCHYWVKVDDDSEYKPATVREMYKDRSMYFCFTNGSVKECHFVRDYKPLNFN